MWKVKDYCKTTLKSNACQFTHIEIRMMQPGYHASNATFPDELRRVNAVSTIPSGRRPMRLEQMDNATLLNTLVELGTSREFRDAIGQQLGSELNRAFRTREGTWELVTALPADEEHLNYIRLLCCLRLR